MLEDRLQSIEERLNAIYDKECSRALTESRLIEEIIRLEKLEVEFNRMVEWVKKNGMELKNLSHEIDQITSNKIASCAAEIASVNIIDAVIRNLEYARGKI